MDLLEARRLAQGVVDAREAGSGVPLAICDPSGQRIDQGWVFYWNSRKAVATQNPLLGLVGQGPLIILDNGRILEGGSAERPDDVLYRFGLIGQPEFDAEVEWAAWKGSRHSAGGAEYRAKACVEDGQTPRAVHSVVMKRTTEPSVWRIRFEIPPGPHEHFRTGLRVTLFEGGREVARAELGRKVWLSRS